MTVSDWGSHGAPGWATRSGPGYTHTRAPQPGPFIHPAHGGPAPTGAPGWSARPAHGGGYGMQAQAGPGGQGSHAARAGYTAAPGYAAPQGYAAPGYAAQGYTAPGYASAPGHAMDPGEADPEAPASPGLAGILNIVGAVVSVALVVGLGVWGYELAMRDVTEVPVVRALAGPMRIQPDEPGGAVAPHQGLAVNQVAADGISDGPVDQVVLAPPADALAPEDLPARPEAEVTAAATRPATMAMPGNATDTGTGTVGRIDADAAVAEALGLTDLPGDIAPLGTSPGAPAANAPEVIPESVPGVARSPRPMPRPASLVAIPAIAAPTGVETVAAAAGTAPPVRPVAAGTEASAASTLDLGREIDPSAIAAGTRLVQLGAYESPEAARAQWQAIAAQNPELFRGRDWTIEQGESGGRIFYRLRATGFDGLSDARSFCATLVAAQGSCVPVVEG